MIKVNATIGYMVVLCMIGFALRAEESATKASIDEAIHAEGSRLYQAVAQGRPFNFNHDLLNRVGLEELIEIFFPAAIWDSGVLLDRNVAAPAVIPRMHQPDPGFEFASLHPVLDPEDMDDEFDSNLSDTEAILRLFLEHLSHHSQQE